MDERIHSQAFEVSQSTDEKAFSLSLKHISRVNVTHINLESIPNDLFYQNNNAGK